MSAGAHVYAPGPVKDLLAAKTYEAGDTLPGGVEAHAAFYPGECVLWIPSHRALVFAESLYGIDGSPRKPPPEWLPEGATVEDFKASLAPLAGLEPEWILTTHGEPIADAASGLHAILGA